MELTLLNKQLQKMAVIDDYRSLIWKDKYSGFGEFEIVLPINSKVIPYLVEDWYISLRNSGHLMVIDTISIHSDSEEGTTLTVKGPSLESILDRRIVWNKTVLDGNLQDAIKKLLEENAIFPNITLDTENRRISRLKFLASDDPVLTALTISAQVKGNLLGQTINDICLSKGVGYAVYLDENNDFVFFLYLGQDRSHEQIANPYVTFSPKFENIVHSDYIQSSSFLRTVTLVAGEVGIGNGRTEVIVSTPSGPGTDLDRRELYTDAGGVSRTVIVNGESTTLTEELYLKLLEQKGSEELAKNVSIQTFEGQVDATRMYKYGEDFFMGDLVEVLDEYGHEARSQVLEIIFAEDNSGIRIYPTFGAVPA